MYIVDDEVLLKGNAKSKEAAKGVGMQLLDREKTRKCATNFMHTPTHYQFFCTTENALDKPQQSKHLAHGSTYRSPNMLIYHGGAVAEAAVSTVVK